MTPASEIRPPPAPRPWTLGRIHLPQPALGELYALRGVPWARLLDRRGHGIPPGWRELARQRREA